MKNPFAYAFEPQIIENIQNTIDWYETMRNEIEEGVSPPFTECLLNEFLRVSVNTEEIENYLKYSNPILLPVRVLTEILDASYNVRKGMI